MRITILAALLLTAAPAFAQSDMYLRCDGDKACQAAAMRVAKATIVPVVANDVATPSPVAFEPTVPFADIGFVPAITDADYTALREAYNSSVTTDDERAYMSTVAERYSSRGATDWKAVRAEYFPARQLALDTHRAIGDPEPAKHHNFWNGVGQVAAAILVVAAGAYVDTVQNNYHTSSSYTDSHGHTVTVRCSTYVGTYRVDSNCN